MRSLLPDKSFIASNIFCLIPYVKVRIFLLECLGLTIGKGSNIFMHTEIISVEKLKIGNNCTIGNHCSLDSRGGLTIGNQCNISSHTLFVSGNHNIHSPDFEGCELGIIVEDYVWICTRSLILGGVTIGEGAVVAAGAVVTRSVEPYTVVAGIPAKVIGKRAQGLSYSPSFMKSWI